MFTEIASLFYKLCHPSHGKDKEASSFYTELSIHCTYLD